MPENKRMNNKNVNLGLESLQNHDSQEASVPHNQHTRLSIVLYILCTEEKSLPLRGKSSLYAGHCDADLKCSDLKYLDGGQEYAFYRFADKSGVH